MNPRISFDLFLSLITSKDAIFDKHLNFFAASDTDAFGERYLLHAIFEIECKIKIFVLEEYSPEEILVHQKTNVEQLICDIVCL